MGTIEPPETFSRRPRDGSPRDLSTSQFATGGSCSTPQGGSRAMGAERSRGVDAGLVVVESLDARVGSQVSRAASDCSGRAFRGHRELSGHHGAGRSRTPGLLVVDGWDPAIPGLRSGRGALSGANTAIIFRPDGLAFRSGWRAVLRAVKRHRYVWLARTLDPMAVPTLCHVLWGIYYICVFIALVLLVRSRVNRLPLSLWLDGVVVGLARRRWRRWWRRPCWWRFSRSRGDQSGLPGGGPAAACPGRWCDVIVSVAAAAVIVVAGRRPAGVRVRRLHLCDPGRARHLPTGRLGRCRLDDRGHGDGARAGMA